jgi:PAS domain S-box-containing protein
VALTKKQARLVDRVLAESAPRLRCEMVLDLGSFETLLGGEPPELIITDLELPWLVDVDPVRALRGQWPTCPLLVLSAVADPERAAAAIQGGATAFVFADDNGYARLASVVERCLRPERNASATPSLERALTESESRFRSFAEAASDFLWELDENLRFKFVSERARKWLGELYPKIIGRTTWELASAVPESSSHWRRHLADLRAHRPFRDFHYRLPKGESWRAFRLSGVPVFDSDGTFCGYRGTATDETDQDGVRRRAEDAESKLHTIVQNLPGVFYQRRLSPEGLINYPYVSGGIESLLGYTAAEVEAQPAYFSDAVDPADSADYQLGLARSARAMTPLNTQVRMRRLDGQLIWTRVVAVPARQRDGSTVWNCVCTDITAHRRLENSFQELMQTAPLALLLVDEAGVVKLANPHSESLFGYSDEGIVGRSVKELLPEESQEALRHSRAEGSQRVLRARRGDGTDFDVEVVLSPVSFLSGQQTLAVLTDVTERRRAEQQLLHAQKLEAIGHLAAGIAHEINTPSQYVTDNLQFLSDSFSDLLDLQNAQAQLLSEARQGLPIAAETLQVTDSALLRADMEYLTEQIPRALSQSMDGMQRIAHIVGAMKEFSHPGGADKQAVDLPRLVDNAVTVASNEWKYVAELKVESEPNLPLIPCHPDELGQVVLNLVVNAAHAIAEKQGKAGGKGEIRIKIAHVGEWAELRISDDGPGVPAAIRHRIFDPFFTTKGVGRGTGQGLAIAHAVVVNKHHGIIDLQSTEGQGTTFIVRIPLDSSGTDDELRGVTDA